MLLTKCNDQWMNCEYNFIIILAQIFHNSFNDSKNSQGCGKKRRLKILDYRMPVKKQV